MTTSDDTSLLPAIDAKLLSIAGPEGMWPDWYHGWRKLGPGSTDAQRVAACQAIWDSGELPADAGFSLMAWQITAIADRLAAARLKHLTNRMNAIEAEYEKQHGHPWPQDEEPAEFSEAFLEYDEACSQIFVECLDALGESEMAEYYLQNFTAFNRRYERGMKFFESVGHSLASPDEIVQVASFFTTSQADVARMALESEDIRVAMDNANLVNADWFLSNAVQGVKLFVQGKDAARAQRIIHAMRTRTPTNGAKQECPSCGQSGPAGWDVCWKCGHVLSVLGSQEPASDSTTTSDADGQSAVGLPTELSINQIAEKSILDEAEGEPLPTVRPLPIFQGIFLVIAFLAFLEEPLLVAMILSVITIVCSFYYLLMRGGSHEQGDQDAH
jgi:hypothetical protein